MNKTLNEGGNVFKDETGQPVTQRINQADIPPTVSWLEKVTGLPLLKNMLGSTGLKPTSGDLDLGVDANSVDKNNVYNRLTTWARNNDLEPTQWVAKTGISVHFKTPIRGNPELGYVQTDLMFVPDMKFANFMMRQDPASKFPGAVRNVLMNSIAKASGYKLSLDKGLLDRASNNTVSKDPDEIAKLILNQAATQKDMSSVEAILQALSGDPDRDTKLADFRGYAEKQNIQFEELDINDEVSIMSRLRDRIVNQGMEIIVEGARIPHPEDEIFDKGSAGAAEAINAIEKASDNPGSTTIKWDGKPAIVFGRDAQGNFILTDKGGFLKSGGVGLAKSPDDLADLLAQRKGDDRSELIQKYRNIWPLIKSITPNNFRGYIQADLLYTGRPAENNNAFVFKPNTVTYSVPVNSELGKQISSSQIGLAVHSYLQNPDSNSQPVGPDVLGSNPDVMTVGAKTTSTQPVPLDKQQIAKVKQLIKSQAPAIDAFLNSGALRAQKMANLNELLKQYINFRVRQGNLNDLVNGFVEFASTKTSPAKAQRIAEWIQQNAQGFKATMTVFMAISNLKSKLIRDLDKSTGDVQASVDNEPGHEGYVGQGYKYVDRARFSKANFAQNP